MSLKFFFGTLIVLFLIVFISSQDCTNPGQTIGNEYCNPNGFLEPLKQGGETCLNNYECAEGSCVESICQSKFPSFQERSDILQNIWFFFSGEECDPKYDTDYHCIGQVAYLCGENYVWEEKGEIPGLCGVTTSGGGKRIDIIIFSPKNVTYDHTQIALQVIDKNKKANYWRYSLNSGQKTEFTPNTTINAAIGFNRLKVYASKYSSFSSEEEEGISFTVITKTLTGFCGDGYCENNENPYTCSEDCGEPPVIPPESYCGDGVCDLDESSVNCPGDCPAKARKDFTWLFFVLLALVIALILVIGFLLIRRFRKKIMKMEKSTPSKPIQPQKMPLGKPVVNPRQLQRPFPQRPMTSAFGQTKVINKNTTSDKKI